MKKSVAKSTAAKTPAPATKAVSTVKPAAKKPASAVKKAAAPAPAPAPVVAPVAAPAVKAKAKPVATPKPAPAAKAAPAPKAEPAPKVAKAPAPKPQAKGVAVTTTIVAAIDVGFGNHLTVRGEGPGLSWEAGVVLECSADDRWTITLPESSQPIVCKFLINDSAWCVGDDYTVLPGSSVVLSPTF